LEGEGRDRWAKPAFVGGDGCCGDTYPLVEVKARSEGMWEGKGSLLWSWQQYDRDPFEGGFSCTLGG